MKKLPSANKLRSRNKPATAAEQSYPPTTPTIAVSEVYSKPNRGYWVGPVMVFVGLMVVYGLTMPHVVTFEDSGFFILNCYNGSIAHPPGYPLYSLLCYPVSHWPFASPALNLNILSALFAALACAVLYTVAVAVLGRPIYGYVAALSWGLSDALWSQAIIQEVYSLNALLFALLFGLALAVGRHAQPRHLMWMALVYGLALSNHWPLIILSTPALLLLMFPKAKQVLGYCRRPRYLLVLSGLLAVGLSPYIYLIIRGNSSPFVDEYGPMDSLAKIAHYIGRTGYASIDQQNVHWGDKLEFARFLLMDPSDQFGWLALALVVLGFGYQWRLLRWPLSVAITCTYVATTWLLIVGLLNFEYSELMVHTIGAYTGIAYAAFGLWLALGLRLLLDWLCAVLPIPAPTFSVTAGLALVGIVGSIAANNYADNNRHADTVAYDYAHTVLGSLSENATLLIDSDNHFPLRALNKIEKVRTDVELYNIQGILDHSRYVSPWINQRQQRRKVRSLIRHAKGQVYYFSDFKHNFGIEDFGLYKKIRKDWSADTIKFKLSPPLLEYMAALDLKPSDNLWNRNHSKRIRGRLAQLLIGANPDSALAKPWVTKLLQGEYYGKLVFTTLLLAERYAELLVLQNQQLSTRLLDLLEQIQQQMDRNTPAFDRAQLYYLKGMVAYAPAMRAQFTDQGDDRPSNLIAATADSESNWLRSLELHPTRNNPAWSLLSHLYSQREQEDKLNQLRARYQ